MSSHVECSHLTLGRRLLLMLAPHFGLQQDVRAARFCFFPRRPIPGSCISHDEFKKRAAKRGGNDTRSHVDERANRRTRHPQDPSKTRPTRPNPPTPPQPHPTPNEAVANGSLGGGWIESPPPSEPFATASLGVGWGWGGLGG